MDSARAEESPLPSDVQAHLCSLLGCEQETDLQVLLTSDAMSWHSDGRGKSPAQQSKLHLLGSMSSDFSEEMLYNVTDASSEKSSASMRSSVAPQPHFGLTAENFERVGGWENLSLAVEEARSKIDCNQDLVRALQLTSPLPNDSDQSPHEMTTSLISSLSGLVLQSSELGGSPHYFHLHFSHLWSLSSSLVDALARCVVDSLMEREGISWPGDEIVQATPKYYATVALHKIKGAFASLVNYKPHLSRVDEDEECEHSNQRMSGSQHRLSRFGCQSLIASPQGSTSTKSLPLPLLKMGRSSMDSKRETVSVQDIMAAYAIA